MNQITLIGRLGQDPELKSAGSNSVVNVSLATSSKYKNRDGELVEDTQWHRLTIWGRQGEVVSDYVKKGDQIAVVGEMRYRKYENKDGIEVTAAEVQVSKVHLLGNGRSNDASADDAPPKGKSAAKASSRPVDDDDDLPF